MNEKIKQQWVAALRSDKFHQGTDQLVKHRPALSTTRHCVLGVLCHLAVEAGEAIGCQAPHPDEDPEYDDIEMMDGYADLNGNWAFEALPIGVRKWAGLEAGVPIIKTNSGTYMDLTTINDHGVSFNVMAKLIDEQL